MNDQVAMPGPESAPSPSSTLSSPHAATPAVVSKSDLGRLTKIEIENYRAFRGNFDLDLPGGCNLLVYGENGSGKSSLFHAIRDFLESPDRTTFDKELKKNRSITPEDYRHRFNTAPSLIRLSFAAPPIAGTNPPARTFEWSSSKNDPKTSEMRTVDKGKGFLDYKALLRVHMLPTGAREINLFDLSINPLLARYKNPVGSSNLTFSQEWNRIRAAFAPRVWKPAELDDWKRDFNAGFERVVKDVFAFASELLKDFDPDLAVEMKFKEAEYSWRPKKLVPPTILVKASFRLLQHDDYYDVLNEARLTALAIAIYFAGLKLSPVAVPRMLVLDDILIGLDMAHRVKVLDIIQKHFKDWQVLILTYSKAWFERLKEQVNTRGKSWANPWRSVVLWEEWHDGEKSPRVVTEGSGNLLDMAETHLKRKDYAAVAVYVRKALESLCHRTCARAHLFVLHVESPKHRKVEHLLTAMRGRLEELCDQTRRAEALALLVRVDQARAFVLNRNAHFDVDEEDTLSGEVAAAAQSVKDLETFLDQESWEGEHFRGGYSPSAAERFAAHLAASRNFVGKAAPRQALNSLAAAHEVFWEVFGAHHKLLVPVGSTFSANKLWEAAKGQGMLTAAIEARLKAARPYLYSTIKTKAFDAAKCEEAARLLEELASISGSSPVNTPATQGSTQADAVT